jgi:hypothetical protein
MIRRNLPLSRSALQPGLRIQDYTTLINPNPVRTSHYVFLVTLIVITIHLLNILRAVDYIEYIVNRKMV